MAEIRYDPQAPDVMDDPFPTYAKMRARCPVQHVSVNGQSYYVLFRHEDVRRAQVRVDRFHSGTGPSPSFRPRGVLFDDGPTHRAMRNVVLHRLSEGAVARYRDRITAIADRLIDEMMANGNQAELHDAYAVPLPVNSIALFLGLCDEQYEDLKVISDRMIDASWNVRSSDYAESFAEACRMFDTYLDRYAARLAAQGVTEPDRGHVGTVLPDDFIADVLCGRVEGRYLARSEQHALLIALLLGGNETTTFAITNTLWRLLERPERWERLKADPDRLIDPTVEESLRHDPPNLGLWRTTACPLAMHGVEMPENVKVQMSYASANRDDTIFTNPADFDMERPREELQRHMSFGVGSHSCVGQNLARLEVRTTLRLFVERLPGLKLAGPMERVGNYAFWGRRRLPLAW
jgi:cytochrome P450